MRTVHHPDGGCTHIVRDFGPSYTEVRCQRDTAREEARLCHEQCVDLVAKLREASDRTTGWRVIVVGAFVAGLVLGLSLYWTVS